MDSRSLTVSIVGGGEAMGPVIVGVRSDYLHRRQRRSRSYVSVAGG